MAWLQLTLRLSAEAFPRTEALLELAGAVSISISDDGDSPILEPEPGTAPLWPKITVRALFPETANPDAVTALLDGQNVSTVSVERIAAEALASTPEPVAPLRIGPRLALVPADRVDPGDETCLGLHLGLAFGTGRHPTTRLCLEWLEREAEPGISVLDYGAGSGVLALAALRLGAGKATAIDNEPQALAATRRNAALNGLGHAITVERPDRLPEETFDLILANILARPLMELADVFAGCQPPGGRIVLSGILESQLDEVQARYDTSYEAFEEHRLEGWGLITARRRARYDR